MNELLKSNYTLLYAEDEPQVREVYTTVFGDYFNVIAVENGKQAWEAYLKHKPEVIVLDILMPELDGVQVAKKIREIDNDAIIIIMTANDTKEWLLSSVELGLTKFIKKGAMKFSQYEAIMEDIIRKLDEKNKEKTEETQWHITPKDSELEIVWDLVTHTLYKNGEKIDLSKKLTQIISYFSRNRDKVISCDEIAKELWGEEEQVEEKADKEGNLRKTTPNDQKIRAFLYTIKNKVGVELFKSHYKQGYTLELVGGEQEHEEQEVK